MVGIMCACIYIYTHIMSNSELFFFAVKKKEVTYIKITVKNLYGNTIYISQVKNPLVWKWLTLEKWKINLAGELQAVGVGLYRSNHSS